MAWARAAEPAEPAEPTEPAEPAEPAEPTEIMDIAEFGSTFLALGPPAILLAGTAVTAVAAVHLTGRRMWWTLALGPLLTLGSALAGTWLVITVLQPGEGSGFLLGGVALGLYALLVTPYYLILAGLGFYIIFRNSRANEGRGR